MNINIEELKQINIIDFCKQNGIDLKQDSNEYYRLKHHDSCVISYYKNLFKWNSQNRGGDILDFIEIYYGCSFKDAVQKLTNNDYKLSVQNYASNKKAIKKTSKFLYDSTNEVPKSYRARDYLINTRYIDSSIVDELINKRLIRQDKKGNALFIWQYENKIVGCS